MTQHVGSDSTFRDAFLEGAAKAFFATAYADYVEEADSTDNDLDEVARNARANCARPGPGEDWMDYLPEIPPNAYALAGELWAALHAANGEAGVYSLALRAEAVDGKAPDPEQFGHCLAMEAMGHGVSWFDDHAKFKIKIPDVECSQCSFSDDAYNPPKPAKRRRG
jgi:hypothetical protein